MILEEVILSVFQEDIVAEYLHGAGEHSPVIDSHALLIRKANSKSGNPATGDEHVIIGRVPVDAGRIVVERFDKTSSWSAEINAVHRPAVFKDTQSGTRSGIHCRIVFPKLSVQIVRRRDDRGRCKTDRGQHRVVISKPLLQRINRTIDDFRSTIGDEVVIGGIDKQRRTRGENTIKRPEAHALDILRVALVGVATEDRVWG